MLNNILRNAINFTDEGGLYLATMERGNGELEIFITDTGTGMTEEDFIAIFEPFRQADNSLSRNYEGTGLDVSIKRACCSSMAQGWKFGRNPGPGRRRLSSFRPAACSARLHPLRGK